MTYILFISVRKQFNFFTSILKRFFNKTFFVQVGTTIHLCKKLKDTKNVHICCNLNQITFTKSYLNIFICHVDILIMSMLNRNKICGRFFVTLMETSFYTLKVFSMRITLTEFFVLIRNSFLSIGTWTPK